MNQLAGIKTKLIKQKIAISDNSSENSIDALKDEINLQLKAVQTNSHRL